MASKASLKVIPSFIAIAAHRGRLSIVTTGWSVVIATLIPLSIKAFGVLKVLFKVSAFPLKLKVGPTIASRFSLLI